MKRKTFSDMNCSVARALDQIGEWWSLLIVRECTFGTTRFDQFQERLGIARNILAGRLKRLVEVGILERVALGDGERAAGYRLTQKGEDLFPVLVALLQWGDKWGLAENGPPVKLVEHGSGKALGPVGPASSSGRPLGLRDVRFEPGPGATSSTEAMVAARNRAVLGLEPDTARAPRRAGEGSPGSAPRRKAGR